MASTSSRAKPHGHAPCGPGPGRCHLALPCPLDTPLVIDAGATSFVWLLATGRPAITTDAAAPTTDAAAITGVVDRRTYASPSRVITLAGELSVGPGPVHRLTVTDGRLYLERVVADVPELGGGTSGETVFEILLNGSTIYPSSGVDDQRLRFAWDSAVLTYQGGVPEPLKLRRGDELHLETAQHAGGGAPPRAQVQLLGWAG